MPPVSIAMKVRRSITGLSHPPVFASFHDGAIVVEGLPLIQRLTRLLTCSQSAALLRRAQSVKHRARHVRVTSAETHAAPATCPRRGGRSRDSPSRRLPRLVAPRGHDTFCTQEFRGIIR